MQLAGFIIAIIGGILWIGNVILDWLTWTTKASLFFYKIAGWLMLISNALLLIAYCMR